MGIYNDVIDWLDRVSRTRFRNPAHLADYVGVPVNQITRWIKKERAPRLNTVGDVLDKLEAKFVFPGESHDTTRPVRFVDVGLTGNGRHEHLPLPQPDFFRAIPVVSGEVAAGPGLIPGDGIDSWMLVPTTSAAIRRSSNLLAVRVARGQRSMLPLIHPGATVIVDLDDKHPAGEGRIYLVRDPHDGISIKKVTEFSRHGEQYVTFYSLNAEEYPPFTYCIGKDFEGDVTKAIVGRVVLLWQDLTGV